MKKVAIHPGEMIRDELHAREITQGALALHIGVGAPYLNDIINGRRGLSAEMSWRLGKALGTGPEIWYKLQADYELAQVPAKSYKHIKKL